MTTSDIKVSICSMTYNQENYIKDTLNSFLSQKTNFKFEIIVHDDCSTDDTTNIIREYEKRYPDIIKPIYQKENQYSKGTKIIPLLFEKAVGKYCALCEGDDYWCDKSKLQKQYDFIENHQDCSLITNGCYLLNDSTGKLKKKKQSYKGSRYYSTDEIIFGDGGLFATNSMFFKTEFVKKLPKFYYLAPVGDFPVTIYLSLCGKVYFIDDIMSVYRVNAKGSWSVRQKNGNSKIDIISKRKKLIDGLSMMMNEINEETDFKYDNSIKMFLLNLDYSYLQLTGELFKIKDRKYKNLYKMLKFKGKLKLFIIRNFTFLYKMIK